MKQAFRDVLAFHRKFGCAVGETPEKIPEELIKLRLNLIEEEFNELEFDTGIDDDLSAIADSLADLCYVVIGTAIAYGIDLPAVWDSVQAANMAKEGGGTREDGKILKPPVWRAPDIAGILAAQKPLSELYPEN